METQRVTVSEQAVWLASKFAPSEGLDLIDQERADFLQVWEDSVPPGEETIAGGDEMVS